MQTGNTPEIDWKEESRRFDAVAKLYDSYRPSYPDALFQKIVWHSGIPVGGRILEIGSGTGIATAAFVQRRFSILCLEPGRNLAAIAAEKFRDYHDIEFELARFEDWDERPNRFDLVMSAQAFHWIPKEIACSKAARALKETGCLALFWNWYPAFGDVKLRKELDQVYEECVPGSSSTFKDPELVIKQTRDQINVSECFGPVLVERFPWTARYTTSQYLGLLNTYSDHLRLAEAVRDRLFAGIVSVIDKHGGYIDKPYLAVLYMAKKR